MKAFNAMNSAPERPLAISLLLGVSGWVAGVFMLVFVALLFHPSSAGEAVASGAILLAAAWGLFMVDHDGEQVFIAQLALVLSIAGQCLMLDAVALQTDGLAPLAAAALLLQVIVTLLMPNRLSRAISTFFATMAWALTLRCAMFGAHADWGHGSLPNPGSLPAALAGWLATWAPLVAALCWAVRNERAWTSRGWAPMVRPLLGGLVAGLAFATLASEPIESSGWFYVGRTDLTGLALWPLLSALGALAALAAAFALRRRAQRALCALAALLHVGHFYWALGCSLLVKSWVMLAMGGVFLAAARLLRRGEKA